MTYARQATEDLPDIIWGVEFPHGVDGDSEYRVYASAGPAKGQMTANRGKSMWVGHVVWKRVDDA